MSEIHPHSRILRSKISLAANGKASSFWGHPGLAEIYPDYCFLTHCIIRASVPIMQAAIECANGICAAQRIADPICQRLLPYLQRHIEEERQHDEWLLDDMEVLGMDRDQMLRRIPPAEVAEVVGAQYYWIRHTHPVAVLGYIAVLEGDPPREQEVEAAIQRTGLSRAAFHTVLSHATLDPGHKQEFEAFLDSLPLTPEQEALIGVSAIHTAAGMQRVFARLLTPNP